MMKARVYLAVTVLGLMLGTVHSPPPATAQNVYSSGSTGADGALSFPAASGEHVIDMSEKPDGIWNYTTIDIPAGVIVRFQKNAANTPVIWLATGDVNVAGEVSLDGQAAFVNPSIDPGNEPVGGPGGFAGGLGGRRFDVSGSFVGNPGQGPGGGRPGKDPNQCGGGAGHNGDGATFCGESCAAAGSGYGDRLVQPLIGGSGGGGSGSYETGDGYNGGGGGGALLIASSGNIRVDGWIHASGGQAYGNGGAGSGGSIRLVANRISGAGYLQASGGGGWSTSCNSGAPGYIRSEAYFVQLQQTPNPPHSAGPPLAAISASDGVVRIVRVAGQIVQNPTGNTNSPDVIFSAPGSITIELATTNVPAGTPITVRITAAGQVITVESTPTDGFGNATASATVPAGVGTIQAFTEYVPVP